MAGVNETDIIADRVFRFEKYLEFFEDGTFTWGYDEDNPVGQGQHTIDGQRISFHSESIIDGSARGCPAKGWYNWEYKNKVLSFEQDTDLCAQRIEDTDGKSYVLIEE